MTEFKNPFAEHGYDPGLMDVAVQALKRGRRGEGESVNVFVNGGDNIVELGEADRSAISGLVDKAVGAESVPVVGFGILKIVILKNR